MIRFDTRFSLRILLRLIVLAVVLAVVVLVSLDFINALYFARQITPTGLVINSAIVALFLLGLLRVVTILLRYVREERAVGRFMEALEEGAAEPDEDIDPRSIIVRRYQTLARLRRENAPINHSALASMLLAEESAPLSFPRFINNILILTGVFGTIVALSIALIGASNLLGTANEDVSQMGLVIHGMSTALSTTITAIVSYFFYGYFFLKLLDAKTHLLTGVEQVTSLYLLPRYAPDQESLLTEVNDLVRGLRQAAERMHLAQADYAEAGSRLRQLIAGLDVQVNLMTDDVGKIKHLLREGFRLPTESEER